MNILLDTHTALWWVNEHEKLSKKAQAILLDESNALYMSVASIWEIAIKISIGKLTGLNGGVRALMAAIDEMPVFLLPVEANHVELVERLPFIHRDPFDRLFVAIAKVESLTILTDDSNIRKYDVMHVW